MSTTTALQTDPSSNTEIGPVTFPNAIPVKPVEFDRSTIVQHPKKDIEAISDALAEHKEKFHSTANWVYFSKGKVVPFVGAACHASIPNLKDEAYTKPLGTENGIHRTGTRGNFKATLPFLSWLLYVSPYGEFFLNRDNFEECANTGFIISPTIPQPLFMNMLILTRHFYEASACCFELFNTLTLEKGHDPTIVYSVIFNTLSLFSYPLVEQADHRYMTYSGHRVSSAYSPPVLLNLFNGRYGTATKSTMGQRKTIYGASELFYASESHGVLTRWAKNSQNFQESLRLFRLESKKPSEVYRPPNPFVRTYTHERPVLRQGEFTNQEAVDFVIPWLDAYIREELGKNGQ